MKKIKWTMYSVICGILAMTTMILFATSISFVCLYKPDVDLQALKQDVCLNDCFKNLKVTLKETGFAESELDKINFAELCTKKCFNVKE